MRELFAIVGVVLATLIRSNHALACDADTVPYQLSVTKLGRPDLSCTAPLCFANSKGSASSKNSPSLNVGGNNWAWHTNRNSGLRGALAQCDAWYDRVCSGRSQWTGGLREMYNGTHKTLMTKCCTSRGMDRGLALPMITIGPQDRFTGGGVYEDGRLVAFDIIKEVVKMKAGPYKIPGDNNYILKVFRIPCDVDQNRSTTLSNHPMQLIRQQPEVGQAVLPAEPHSSVPSVDQPPQQKQQQPTPMSFPVDVAPPMRMIRNGRRRMRKRKPRHRRNFHPVAKDLEPIDGFASVIRRRPMRRRIPLPLAIDYPELFPELYLTPRHLRRYFRNRNLMPLRRRQSQPIILQTKLRGKKIGLSRLRPSPKKSHGYRKYAIDDMMEEHDTKRIEKPFRSQRLNLLKLMLPMSQSEKELYRVSQKSDSKDLDPGLAFVLSDRTKSIDGDDGEIRVVSNDTPQNPSQEPIVDNGVHGKPETDISPLSIKFQDAGSGYDFGVPPPNKSPSSSGYDQGGSQKPSYGVPAVFDDSTPAKPNSASYDLGSPATPGPAPPTPFRANTATPRPKPKATFEPVEYENTASATPTPIDTSQEDTSRRSSPPQGESETAGPIYITMSGSKTPAAQAVNLTPNPTSPSPGGTPPLPLPPAPSEGEQGGVYVIPHRPAPPIVTLPPYIAPPPPLPPPPGPACGPSPPCSAPIASGCCEQAGSAAMFNNQHQTFDNSQQQSVQQQSVQQQSVQQQSVQQQFASAPEDPAAAAPVGGADQDAASASALMQCFSGDMTVQTAEGRKAMRDLKVGDMVLSTEDELITYSPVLMFLHRLPEERAKFFLIEADNGIRLKVTENHLIYTKSCERGDPLRLVHAKDLLVGECIYRSDFIDGGSVFYPALIDKITTIVEDGIYAPLTMTGDIVVNDVLASCHSNLAMQHLQQSFFSLFRSFTRHFMPWSMAHTAISDSQLPLGLTTLANVLPALLPSNTK